MINPMSINPIILQNIIRFFGVFLSPRAFLKSLMTLLNEKLLLVLEDIEPETEFCPLSISPNSSSFV
jgi:hypothetical protein